MAAQSSQIDPSQLQNSAQRLIDDGTPRTTSSPGTSRHTKRLQLRNAGFRGAALPTRKITPKSVSSSGWSTLSGIRGSSDVENVSPSGTRAGSSDYGRRESSGILQDIGNSTVTHRPKRQRQRLTSNKPFDLDSEAQDEEISSRPHSPPAPRSTTRQRSARSKAKVSLGRRSVSAETSKYIEHLEAELASTQSQLSSVTSSSATREQSSKMRTLNAETKHLQEELADWEAKYEQRVQEEVDRHFAIETDLRARIRHLEQDAEEAKFRIQELETQVEITAQDTQAVEKANVNLEKRLEIMSELLASTKIDLRAQTPGRRAKHIRPKSMLPRFPTTSSLVGFPERQPRTQPASPMLTFTSYGSGAPTSPTRHVLPLDDSNEHTDYMSEVESIFSEDSATGDSMTSAENFDSQPTFAPWSIPAPTSTKPKPVRRMRRFGPGSVGPKPLILPSTSHFDPYPPASAPPLEHSITTPTFFPPRAPKSTDSGSPIGGRRRASTTANEMTIPNFPASPFLDIEEQNFNEDTLISLTTPPSAGSHMTTRRYSSIESPAGQNLMEELSAAHDLSMEDAEPSSEDNDDLVEIVEVCDSPKLSQDAEETIVFPAVESNDEYDRSTSSGTVVAPTTSSAAIPSERNRSRSLSIPMRCSESMFGRLRILFGDLWHSPLAMARYLVQAAQACMRIPRPLLNVQWWLVGVLLGPMAKRRMLESRKDLEEQPLIADDTPTTALENASMDYGTFKHTPAEPRTRRTNRMTGKIGKRAGSKTRCVHRRNKHSPWLWIKFSITLAFAIGAAFKDGPGSLLRTTACRCQRRDHDRNADEDDRQVAAC